MADLEEAPDNRRPSNFSVKSNSSNASNASNNSKKFGTAIIKKSYDFDMTRISQLRAELGPTLEDESSDDILAELEELNLDFFQPSRKNSEGEFFTRRRSLSMPEKISFHITTPTENEPPKPAQIPRANSLPSITEYGRLASFPSSDILDSLPPEIRQRIEAVDLRHTHSIKKKMILISRAKAIKERNRRITKRLPYFRTCEERETYQKTDEMEPGDGLDCFPSILFASGFTGVTYTENNENKRELGRLICYPENDSNEINDERIIQCEQRRQFAKTKKEQFIRRSLELKEMKKSNKMHVTFTDKVQKKRDHIPSSLRKSSIDSTSSSFSDQSDKTVNETNISLQTSTSVNSMNSQLSINEENPEVLIHEDEENDTFDEHFSQPKNYTLPFLDVPIKRRNSFSIIDERVIGKTKDDEESEMKEEDEEEPIYKNETEEKTKIEPSPKSKWKPFSTPLFNFTGPRTPNQRRLSFSILDWTSPSEDEDRKKNSVTSLESPLSPRKISVNSMSSLSSVSSLNQIANPIPNRPTSPNQNSSLLSNSPSKTSLPSSSPLPPRNNNQRRNSLPLTSVQELMSLAEIKPACEVIEEITSAEPGHSKSASQINLKISNETTPSKTKSSSNPHTRKENSRPRGVWRLTEQQQKSQGSISSISEYAANFSSRTSTNPLFNLDNIDFRVTSKENEEIFKERFKDMSSKVDESDEDEDVE